MGVAIRSMFFDDTDYTADDFVESNKALIKDGIIATDTEQLKVVAGSNMTVAIKTGGGWVQGHSFVNGSTAALTLSNADGVLNRIDRVVVRLYYASKKTELVVLTGTTASTPVSPTLVRDGTYYDLCLATISVAKGVTAITDTMITDNRSDGSLCGWAGAYTSDTLNFALKANVVDVGDKTTLTTTAKDNLVGAINELASTTLSVDSKITANTDKIYSFSPYTNKAIFTASGSWTCPANVKKVAIWLQDGGAGSGGVGVERNASSNSSGYKSVAQSADGKSGGWGMWTNIDVVAGTTYSIVVGAGGAAGIAPTVTTWTDTATCTTGGVGGKSSAFGKSIISESADYCFGSFAQQNNYTATFYQSTIPSQQIASIKTGTDVNIFEKALSFSPIVNGGLGVLMWTDVHILSGTKIGNAGTAGKVVIYY